jgi:beta-phosphoglucomutase-like phosphatase (HAD superfamily)
MTAPAARRIGESRTTTSSAHETVRDHLAAHELSHRFHSVIGEGDYENSKPAPDAYLVAAIRLGVSPSSCLALEDSPHGVRSAAAAGMMTVMVPDLTPPTEELRRLCLFVAPSLHDVARFVERSAAKTC